MNEIIAITIGVIVFFTTRFILKTYYIEKEKRELTQ